MNSHSLNSHTLVTCSDQSVNSDLLSSFIYNLHYYLIHKSASKYSRDTITKVNMHKKNLQQSGELNFPFRLRDWFQAMPDIFESHKEEPNLGKLDDTSSVFTLLSNNYTTEEHVDRLLQANYNENWPLRIKDMKVINQKVHIFLDRHLTLDTVIRTVIQQNKNYGCKSYIDCIVSFNDTLRKKKLSDINLTELRLLILENFTQKLSKVIQDTKSKQLVFEWTFNSSRRSKTRIVCGPVLNEHGLKDLKTTAEELYEKRANDMRMMAQHKYGVQVKQSTQWKEYFDKLGRAAVIVEMLQQKPHKATKVTLNNVTTATHKGASFIFYNCARLSTLFREFNQRVAQNIYPELPGIDTVDFSLLKEPEEWELLYATILQFPIVVGSCLNLDEYKQTYGVAPQNIVVFLSQLCSTFSGYYRRVKILTEPRDHMFATMFARLYLLKALQIVLHNALDLLDIEPVKEM